MTDLAFDKGWVLRKSRHLYQPGEVLDATNLLNAELGALRTRPGMTTLGSVAGELHSYYQLIGQASNPTYQALVPTAAPTHTHLFRNFTTALVDAPAVHIVDFCDMRGFQTDESWVFVAGGQDEMRVKDNGTVTYKWGINQPSVAPTLAAGAAGTPNGTYTFRYIYVRESGGLAMNWGNPSPISAPITVTSDIIALSAIGDPSNLASPDYDPQVTHIYIYATQADALDIWFYAGSVAVGTTTFNFNLADTDLPVASSLPSGLLETDNGEPPAFDSICVHQDRIWGIVWAQNRAYYSKVGRPEQFSATAYLELGPLSDRARVVREYNGHLYIRTQARVWEILGTDETSYLPRNTNCPVGTMAPFTDAQGLRGRYWLGPDGIYRWDGSQAVNITDEKLYPLFHSETVNGFAPVVVSGPENASGGWINGRYYLSYPTVAGGPSRSLIYDELTDNFFADTRAVRRYHYVEQTRQLVGCIGGVAYAMESGTTDAGAAITHRLQTRDEVAQDPTADLQFTQLAVDLNGSVAASLIQNFGATTTSLGTLTTTARGQDILALATTTVIQAKSMGFLLTGTGVATIYRILPQLLTLPGTRLAVDMLPSNLGYAGPKRIVGVWVDTQLLEAGTLTPTLNVDGASIELVVQTSVTRRYQDILGSAVDGTLIGYTSRSTAPFRQWPHSYIAWVPLPAEFLVYQWPSSILGTTNQKIIQAVSLDIELVDDASVTFAARVDAQALLSFPAITAEGRTLTGRMRFPRTAVGQRLEWQLQSTGRWRLWGGEIFFTVLGSREGLQRLPFTTQAGNTGPTVQQSPLAA